MGEYENRKYLSSDKGCVVDFSYGDYKVREVWIFQKYLTKVSPRKPDWKL